MVSNQKPIKNLGRNPPIDGKAENKKDLEKRINNVLNVCQDIIKCNNNFMNKQNATSKKNPAESKPPGAKPATPKPTTPKSAQPANAVKKNASGVTLEKVTQDMSNILKDLKDHLPKFKCQNDSFSDVVPKLEESFWKSNQNADKTGFFKNCRPPPQNNRPNSTSSNKSNNQGKSKPVSQINARSSSARSNAKTVATPANHSASNDVTRNLPKASTSSRQGSILHVDRFPLRAEYNPLGVLKAEVQKAIKEKKTFTIKGNFPAVRRALLNRGWVEKLYICYRDRINEEVKKFHTYSIPQLVELLRNKDTCQVAGRLIKSKLLADNQVDLYWSYNYDSFKECPDKIKLTKMNRLRRDFYSYASKVGLCNANKRAAWFRIPGVANLNHPRTYSLMKNGDTPEFIKDFNKTAAMSLLKWVVKNNITGEYKVLSPSGKIPIEVFDFAINECYKFIKKAQHEDVDSEIKEALEYEWNEFLEYFYKTVHIGNHFKKNSNVAEIDMVRKANFILGKLEKCWPPLEMDGMMNIWILKPTDGSQGVGIHICRTLQYILRTIKGNPNRRYIIQKYIERPLLIHNTKFDIRQWFLISSTVPLMIWMYKQCYLRFSSQTYNLRKLHESIHLTNNSVQSRYRQTNRDIALPSYDMWDLGQFKNYLSDKGYPSAFDTVIYPGMKQCIVAAVIMYQDKLEKRKNCFELYGADFMITEDFKPWLIEINSNPALHASTPVTARMCPLVLEDVIKVVVDYEANKSASTGHFELVYRTDLPMNIKVPDLQVQGTPLTPDYFYTPPANEMKSFEIEKSSAKNLLNMQGLDAIDYVRHIGNGMRKTLEDLLEILKKEKHKRHERKNKSIITILSNMITETKESQTEYDERNGISEALITSQILELEQLETSLTVTENDKKESSGPDKGNATEKEKNNEPKKDIVELESRQKAEKEDPHPQEIETKCNEELKPQDSQKNRQKTLPGHEIYNDNNKTTTKIEQLGKYERQRKSIFKCKSYTYGKAQSDKQPKMIFHSRSDIKKIQENGNVVKQVQSKLELASLKETKTIVSSKGLSQDKNDTKTNAASGSTKKENEDNENRIATDEKAETDKPNDGKESPDPQAKELNEATKRTLLNFFRKAKKNVKK